MRSSTALLVRRPTYWILFCSSVAMRSSWGKAASKRTSTSSATSRRSRSTISRMNGSESSAELAQPARSIKPTMSPSGASVATSTW